MKTLNLCTAKVGETITLNDNMEYSYRLLPENAERAGTKYGKADFQRGTTLKVSGFKTVEREDDHGCLVDGEFFNASRARPEIWYAVNIHSPANGEVIGTLNIEPLDVKERKEMEWVFDLKDHSKHLRLAVKRGQAELVKDLTRAIRKIGLKDKLAKRFKREHTRRFEAEKRREAELEAAQLAAESMVLKLKQGV
jgi:hypothetical protein